MTRWVRVTGVALVLAAVPVAAQTSPSVQVAGPQSNPITDGIATFTITAVNFIAADFPLRFQMQVSTSPDFGAPLFADTTVDAAGASITIVIPRLLPQSGLLYWRAIAFTARAGVVPSAITGPRTAPTHLRLVSPNNPAGQSLKTRRPTFTWRVSTIPASVGAWSFELRVEETATAHTRLVANTSDTTLTPSEDLETNASYRWRVTARIGQTGPTVLVASFASFVLLSDDAPLTTVLHNPFPSPFPSASASSLCVWFDVSISGPVTLSIVDTRGLPVRRLLPSTNVAATLPAGRYGRPSPGATSGCDDRFAWDGTDDRHRVVPPGRYLVRLRAGGRDFTRQVYFAGR